MRLLQLVIASLVIFSLPLMAAKLSELEYITEDYAPFNFDDTTGKRIGFAVELLERVWQDLNIPPQPIRILPWARGYALSMHQKNAVLFSTLRLDSREKLFKWACPIFYHRIVLMARRDSNIDLKELRDANQYSIVAIRSDAGEQLLIENNLALDKLYLAKNLENALRMVIRKRVDLISVGDITASQMLLKMGYDPHELEVKWVLESNPLCFAFNLEVNDKLIRQFQRALNKAHGDRPFIYKLEKKYQLIQN
ncbi:substrate-binding periplasmic protein [Dongshaea marina]|uniref:substrate-binding periplasmic protein n=1 Tax=Dongshaea marina TaxID=2047966 RepID=UPI000D3ED110|nr:transporter substrate-binding domain-containing protein [Dongshaea marina]